jgi:flagellar hook protein FlgE
MSFGIALSGIDAAQSDLNVTANNIANSSTTGYKSSTSEFAELFAVNGSGVSKTQSGNGVALTDIAQNFKQGNISTTGNNLDLAISGDGFFVLKDTSGNIDYTRAGSFQTDASNYVVNAAGQHLQVYPLTSTGTYNTTTLQNLQLTNAASAPSATTSAQTIFNLPSNATAPATAFDPTDASTYNQTTTMTVYDSLGAAHTASIYFVKGTTTSGTSNWSAYEYIDGTQVNTNPLKLAYNSSGVLSSVTNPGGATANPQLNAASFGAYTPTTGAAAMNVSFDFSKSTQYGNTFATTSLTQDGYTTGTLSGISVGTDGVVQANFTNGQSLALGKVAIATFANTQGLQQVANTNWVATYASGTPLYGQAGQSGAGNIQSGALEDSNVDLTAQLVNMIQAQRNFQANAQVITTENQVTQSIINIR